MKLLSPRELCDVVSANTMRVVCNHLMRLRPLLLFLVLLASGRVSLAADTISVKISHFGLEGIYAGQAEPTWVEVTARNTTSQPLSFNLVVSEVSLENDALPVSEVETMPLAFAASETRAVDVPLHIQSRNRAVLYVEALDQHGTPLGRTAIVIGEQTRGQTIAMLCSTADLCRAIRQSILLSGSPEEQTHKSSTLRLIQLSKAPPAGWAYSPADIVILAAPTAELSSAQRDAIEIYVRRGGKLVLVDDQLGDAAGAADHSRILDPYRSHVPEGKLLTVGEGELVHVKSLSSREFSDHFRPLGFTPNTPEEIRQLLPRVTTRDAGGDPLQLNSWLIRRLGTTFRFPSFLELLSWIIAYLVLVGLVNFFILRRIGRPDWGWVTIPALAVLFSALLYAVSARNHPSNFGLDEMTVYRLDSLSPLAISSSRVRVSAPVRSVVRAVLPGNLIEGTGQRPRYPFGAQFVLAGESQVQSEVQLGATWEVSIPLRRWSFHDFQFEGYRRFSGTVFRDSVGRLHNETGLNFRQALVADQRDVFYLGEFPAGAVVDLGHVPRRPYEQETGRRTSNNVANFPGPPFNFRPPRREDYAPEEWMKRSDKEFKDLETQPFALSELIRGWSKHGDDIFAETKAVFFGLSSEGTLGAALRDRTPDRKAAALTVVTFGEWP